MQINKFIFSLSVLLMMNQSGYATVVSGLSSIATDSVSKIVGNTTVNAAMSELKNIFAQIRAKALPVKNTQDSDFLSNVEKCNKQVQNEAEQYNDSWVKFSEESSAEHSNIEDFASYEEMNNGIPTANADFNADNFDDQINQEINFGKASVKIASGLKKAIQTIATVGSAAYVASSEEDVAVEPKVETLSVAPANPTVLASSSDVASQSIASDVAPQSIASSSNSAMNPIQSVVAACVKNAQSAWNVNSLPYFGTNAVTAHTGKIATVATVVAAGLVYKYGLVGKVRKALQRLF